MARIKPSELSGNKRGRGKPPLGSKPNKKVLQRLYVREARSIREVANLQGCTKDMVYRALKEYGIEARPNASRSQLRKIPLTDLEAAIRDKGIRGTARDLGIDEGTIRHHLKVRKGQ
jgi:hypothetical protein